MEDYHEQLADDGVSLASPVGTDHWIFGHVVAEFESSSQLADDGVSVANIDHAQHLHVLSS
jgi:hypothetical protein